MEFLFSNIFNISNSISMWMFIQLREVTVIVSMREEHKEKDKRLWHHK